MLPHNGGRMNSELMKVVVEMRDKAEEAHFHDDLLLAKWIKVSADRLEAIAKAHGEAVATNRRVAPDGLVSLLTAIWSDEHEPEHRRTKAAELLSVLAAATFQENDK